MTNMLFSRPPKRCVGTHTYSMISLFNKYITREGSLRMFCVGLDIICLLCIIISKHKMSSSTKEVVQVIHGFRYSKQMMSSPTPEKVLEVVYGCSVVGLDMICLLCIRYNKQIMSSPPRENVLKVVY